MITPSYKYDIFLFSLSPSFDRRVIIADIIIAIIIIIIILIKTITIFDTIIDINMYFI